MPQRQRPVEDVQLVLHLRGELRQPRTPFHGGRRDQSDNEAAECCDRDHDQHGADAARECGSVRESSPPATAWCRPRRPSRPAGRKPWRNRAPSTMAISSSPTSAIATTSWRRISGGSSAVLSGIGVTASRRCSCLAVLFGLAMRSSLGFLAVSLLPARPALGVLCGLLGVAPRLLILLLGKQTVTGKARTNILPCARGAVLSRRRALPIDRCSQQRSAGSRFHRGVVTIGRLTTRPHALVCGGTARRRGVGRGQSITSMHIPMGQHMTQSATFRRRSLRPREPRFVAAMLIAPAIFPTAAGAQTLGYAPMQPNLSVRTT